MTPPGTRRTPILGEIPVPAHNAENCAQNCQHEQHAEIQTVGCIRLHIAHSFLFRLNPSSPAKAGCYGVFHPSSPPAASFSCRNAAAPSSPPMPIDSTALLGI